MNHDELYKALCKVPNSKEKSRDKIIIELYMRSEGASQKQLVDALNMRPATVSEQTDILIELGYVTKHIDYMDKRISVVGLTEEGKRLGLIASSLSITITSSKNLLMAGTKVAGTATTAV